MTANIESVKNYTVTSPQSTNIVPSEGYDAMSRVFLQYNVPHQSKSVTIRSNGTTSVYPDNGYYGLTGVTIETDVPAQTLAPKICYIGVHNDTSIIGAIIDVGNEIWDVGSSVMVPDGKTLIVLDYDDPPTKLNVIAYYNVAGGTGESRVHLGSNSYYKILNYPMDNYLYLFTANKSLIAFTQVYLTGSQVYKMGQITVDYLSIDYFLPTQLQTN